MKGSLNEAMAGDAPFTQNPLSRIAKVILGAVCWGWLEAVRAAYRLTGRPAPGRATVIYYHQIAPHEAPPFARQMDHLRRWTVPIRADRTEPLPPFSRCVAVTVDDGWLSFSRDALPAMIQRRIPVTIFALTGHLDRDEANHGAADRLLNRDELQAIASDLVTIGSHTRGHALMPALPDQAAWEELQESRAALCGILHRDITLFSFPYGACNDALIALCRRAGYRRVFTGLPYAALREPREFVTGRVRVDPGDWMIEFHLKAIGAYQWVGPIVRLKRRVKGAIVAQAARLRELRRGAG